MELWSSARVKPDCGMSTFLTKNYVLLSGFVCVGLVGGLYYLKKTYCDCHDKRSRQAANDNNSNINTNNKSNDTEMMLDLCGVKEKSSINLKEISQLPVILKIDKLLMNNNNGKNQNDIIFIGIAGPAGSGKTLLSKILTNYFNGNDNYNNINTTFCLSSDAYHLTNEELISKNLRKLKGLPQTMDDKQLYNDLCNIKQMSRDSLSNTNKGQRAENVNINSGINSIDNKYIYRLPIYDRKIHNPRQNAIELNVNETKVIIVEGLFIMHWEKIRKFCDFVIYIDCDMEVCKQRLVNRKLKSGYTLEGALERFETIDKKTFEIVDKHKHLADMIVKSDVIQSDQSDKGNDQSSNVTVVRYNVVES